MDAAIIQARRQNHDQIILVQSPSHIRSFVLYTRGISKYYDYCLCIDKKKVLTLELNFVRLF
jgi:hypothetical protein